MTCKAYVHDCLKPRCRREVHPRADLEARRAIRSHTSSVAWGQHHGTKWWWQRFDERDVAELGGDVRSTDRSEIAEVCGKVRASVSW
jgi:hypothetical protein